MFGRMRMAAERNGMDRGGLLSLALAALPLALAAGGCVVRDAPEPVYYPPPQAPIEVDAEPAPYEPPPQQVLVEDRQDLDPYGHWVQTNYGPCWIPHDRPEGWQPYTVGYWENTDQGWCWVAQGPETDWGLVTYHYGRWYADPAYGWVWVPGDVWAPAWVAWRAGDGYCGWTPLPPQCGEGININMGLVDHYCPPERYVYCDERYIGDRGEERHYERNNVAIINRTTNITNITYVNNRVINRGVEVRNVEARSGRRIERVQLAQANSAAEARLLRQEGRPVVYTPPAVQAAARQSVPRLQRAMAAPRQRPVARQPSNRALQYPAQAGGRNNAGQQTPEQQQAAQRSQQDAQAQRQRQLDNEQRLRQQAADRVQAREQQRAQVQAQERARQQQVQQREEAIRQQRAAEQQRQTQNAAAQRQQAQERQQAERDRAAAERDAARQRGGPNQGPPPQ
jgi:hypothetical protein